MSTSNTSPSSTPSSTVSLYDARPFFEKALVYGVQHGILSPQKLEAICNDAPKGMVQIARYFGNENLRPELEKAKDRMVNLVSLYLESSTGGDLHLAAESLRDHSFMSRSKGGSDMLKALIALPQNSHFGMNEHAGFTDEHIPLLAKWALRSLPEYQAELDQRSQVAQVVDAALWLAQALGMDAQDLEDAGKDAEAVIRTALLALAAKRSEMPDWVAFEKMMLALKKKHAATITSATSGATISAATSAPTSKTLGQGVGQATEFSLPLPKDTPAALRPAMELVRQSVLQDLPKIVASSLGLRKLFDTTPAFMGRYFWLEDSLSEVDDYDRAASAVWSKATKGHTDDGSLLTLFLCLAAGSTATTLLTEKTAASLIRKIRKAGPASGLQRDLAVQYIHAHAPAQYQDDYAQMWTEFLEDAQSTLFSDMDYALTDALSLLRRECNIKQ